MPVVSYRLLNCKNWSEENFENIELHYGVIITANAEAGTTIFEAVDMEGTTVSFVCDKVMVQEMGYRKEDYLELLKSLQLESTINHEMLTKLRNREESLERFLVKELDNSERKQRGAIWLTQKSKHFIEGQQDVLRKILALVNRKD